MRHAMFAIALFLIVVFSVFATDAVSLSGAQVATPEADCPATTEDENKAIALRWHDAISGHDPAVIDEIVADDIIHHAGSFPDGVGPEAVKRVLGALLAGFPDATQTVEDVIAEGDTVVTRWTTEGTHEGKFQGHAPTGKHVSWSGINIFRFECGKIVEEWSELDGLSRIAQFEAAATPTP